MGGSIRVIIVSDDPAGARIAEALTHGERVMTCRVVCDRADFVEALDAKSADLVVALWRPASSASSATTEGFAARQALDMLKGRPRSLPVVVVSPRDGEESAIEAMRAGARDVVMLDRLECLPAVVERELAASRSPKGLRQLFDAGLIETSGAIAIVLMQLDGVYLDANRSFLTMLGYTREDLEAGLVTRQKITPLELHSADDVAMQQLRTGSDLELRAKEYLRKDGTRIQVLLTGMRVDERTAVGFIIDISAHCRIENELRRTTKFLDSILENTPLMIFVKDAEHLRFERINAAGEKLFGQVRSELVGKSDYDFFPPEQAAFFQAKDRETLAMTGPLEIFEEPIETPAGKRHLRTLKMAIRDEHGAPKYLLGISEDITPRIEMQEALRRSEEQFRQAQKMEAIGKLAGGVAHDFNNMLSVILSYATLSMDALSESDPMRQDIEEIMKAGGRAADLTKQLLAFSRQSVAEPRMLDLNEVISHMDRMLRRVVEEDIELRTVPAPSVWRVAADPTQVEQIIMNLVVNARDAMPDGGRLTIETANVVLDDAFAQAHVGAQTGPHVMLAVSDNGTGMDKETLARIFEPFYTTKPVGEGTGLGLSTVYGIVQASGGSIWVYSEVGRGTSFKVYLPRSDKSETMITMPPPSVPALKRAEETILVVEDEEPLLKLVRTVLRRRGYRVLEASSPADAILLCEQHPGVIDLLLTDVVMPRMNGRQLADRLEESRPDMKVVFMSGYTANVVIHHGIFDEGVVLLQKPITPDVLLQKIAEVLASAA